MTMQLDTPLPPMAPPVPVRARDGHTSATDLVALVLATFLLAASIAIGFWLIDSAPITPRIPSAEQLTSQTLHEFYGGDAYTGIQNAAADTENAVVTGTNSVTSLASSLHESRLQADAAW